jgi:hypothetical protein
MTTPHRDAVALKAWLDGHPIEKLVMAGFGVHWVDELEPDWTDKSVLERRVKPEPKSDLVYDRNVYATYDNTVVINQDGKLNLRVIFDGETGYLKEVRQTGKPSPAKMEAILQRYLNSTYCTHQAWVYKFCEALK